MKLLSKISIMVLSIGFIYGTSVYALGVYSCSEGLEELSRIEFNLEDPTYRNFSRDFASVVMMKSPLLFSERHFQILKTQLGYFADSGLSELTRSGGSNLSADAKLELSKRIWSGLTDPIVKFQSYNNSGEVPADLVREMRLTGTQVGLTEPDFLALAKLIAKINATPSFKEKVITLISDSLVKVASLGERVHEIKNRQKFFETISQEQRIIYPKTAEARDTQDGKIVIKRIFEGGIEISETSDLIDLLTIAHPVLWGRAHMDALDLVSRSNGTTPGKLKKSLAKVSSQELQSLAGLTWDHIAKRFGIFEGSFGLETKLDENAHKYFSEMATSLEMSVEDYLQTRLIVHAIDTNPDIKKNVLKIINATYRESLALKLPLKVEAVTGDPLDTSDIKSRAGRWTLNGLGVTALGVGAGIVSTFGTLGYQALTNARATGAMIPGADEQMFHVAALSAAVPAASFVGSKVVSKVSHLWHRHTIKKILAKGKSLAKQTSDSEEE